MSRAIFLACLLSPAMIAVAQTRMDSAATCRPNLVAVYATANVRTGTTGMEWYDSTYWQSGWHDAQSVPRLPERAAYEKAKANALEDCSTERFLCVNAGGLEDIYAVPRTALVAGQHYKVAGREFRVVGCYGVSCRSYVIVVQRPCKDGCTGSAINRLLFIYELSRGITVYTALAAEQSVTAQDVRKFTDEAVRESSWMELRSVQGLLACRT